MSVRAVSVFRVLAGGCFRCGAFAARIWPVVRSASTQDLAAIGGSGAASAPYVTSTPRPVSPAPPTGTVVVVVRAVVVAAGPVAAAAGSARDRLRKATAAPAPRRDRRLWVPMAAFTVPAAAPGSRHRESVHAARLTRAGRRTPARCCRGL